MSRFRFVWENMKALTPAEMESQLQYLVELIDAMQRAFNLEPETQSRKWSSRFG